MIVVKHLSIVPHDKVAGSFAGANLEGDPPSRAAVEGAASDNFSKPAD